MMDRPTNLVDFARAMNQYDFDDAQKRRLIGLFVESKAREQGIPLSGAFELTPFCNLDCKMCYIHLGSDQYDRNKLLTTAQWISIFKQVIGAGMKRATLTGGECLTYPGFDDIFLFLQSHDIDIRVLTNGLALNEHILKLFKENPPGGVQISLYGSNDDIYEQVTGHRVFHQVMENIQRVKEMGLKLQLVITPSAYIMPNLRELVALVESTGIPYEINCKLLSPRKSTGRCTADLTPEQYVEVYRFRVEQKNLSLTPIDAIELKDVPKEGKNQLGIRCGAGRSSFAIRYDGCLMPCISLFECAVPVMEMGFDEAWKRVREFAMNYQIPRECNECAYQSKCIQCVAQHKEAPVGHCDKEICKRTKLLAKEGFFEMAKR